MSLRRLALLLPALALALPAAAQPAFRLASPVVVVDGVRADRAGLVLEQPQFRFLTIAAPGYGRFVVSDRTFPGARRAGDFDGDVLALTVDGRSVRVRAAEPILATSAVVPAYARFDADPAARPASAAALHLAVAGTVPEAEAVAGRRQIRATGRGLSPDPAVRASAADNTTSARLSAEIERLDAEVARLRSELARRDGRPAEATALRAERDRLREDLAVRETETARLQAEVRRLEAALAAGPAPADADVLRAEVARLRTSRGANAAGVDSLRQALALVETESARAADRAAADVVALRAEVDRLDAELRRTAEERDRLRGGVGPGGAMAPAGGPGVNVPTSGPGPLDQPFTEGRLAISLPGFDHSRLRNADEVRGVMAGALLPVSALQGRGSGDVIVLFVTDTDGSVVRTEIAGPVAPEVDAAAERIVRTMRITPPQVDGQNAVLRSQVRVRFSR